MIRPARRSRSGRWLERWLAGRVAPRSSTLRGYAAHVRLYLSPYLGQILLADLSAVHVQAMFTAIVRQHQVVRRPMSTSTLPRVRATLRAALNAAIRAGRISVNAASRAELAPASTRRPTARAHGSPQRTPPVSSPTRKRSRPWR
jgi:hypothetical protein